MQTIKKIENNYVNINTVYVSNKICCHKERFEDIKGVEKLVEVWPKQKLQTIIYNVLHRKLWTE